MDHFTIMEIFEAGQDVPQNKFYLGQVQLNFAVYKFAQVCVAVVHYEVNLVERAEVVWHDNVD